MDVNNVSFKLFQKSTLQTFYEDGKVFNTFIRSQGYKQCALNVNKKNSTWVLKAFMGTDQAVAWSLEILRS